MSFRIPDLRRRVPSALYSTAVATTLTNNAITEIPLGTKNFDTIGGIMSASGNYRVPSPGLYLCYGSFKWNSGLPDAATRQARLLLYRNNGSIGFELCNFDWWNTTTGVRMDIVGSAIVWCDANAELQFRISNGSPTGTHTLDGAASECWAFFSKIGDGPNINV